MKKFILISIIAVAAMGMIGCGEDDGTKADIRWTNSVGTGEAVYDIQWAGSKSIQTWNPGAANALADNATNDFKGVEDLTGEGSCLDLSTGGDNTINIEGDPDGGSYTIPENSATTLVIDNLAKK